MENIPYTYLVLDEPASKRNWVGLMPRLRNGAEITADQSDWIITQEIEWLDEYKPRANSTMLSKQRHCNYIAEADESI